MALQYVGGKVVGQTGWTSGSRQVSLSGLTGGLASSPSAGDIVVVGFGINKTSSGAPNPSGFNNVATVYRAGASRGAALSVSYKVMGATPDANISISTGTGHADNAGIVMIHVWRGQDDATPLDVTRTTADGASLFVDPPAITPATSGAVVIAVGAGAPGGNVASSDYGSSDLAGFLSGRGADVWPAHGGLGSKAWTGGAVNPAAWTGVTDPGSSAWVAITLALRPKLPVAPGAGYIGASSTSPGVTPHSQVSAAGADHVHAASAPPTAAHSVVSPMSGWIGHLADEPASTASSALTAASSAHGLTATEPAISYWLSLYPSASMMAHFAGEPSISAHFDLSPSDAFIAHLLGVPIVTFGSSLAVAGAEHAQVASEPILTHILGVKPASSALAHQVVAPSVGARFILSVNSCALTVLSDVPWLVAHRADTFVNIGWLPQSRSTRGMWMDDTKALTAGWLDAA